MRKKHHLLDHKWQKKGFGIFAVCVLLCLVFWQAIINQHDSEDTDRSNSLYGILPADFQIIFVETKPGVER